MRTVRNLLPHVSLILSGTFITLFILDKFNTEMAFINNNIAKTMLLIFCLVSVCVSLMLILKRRKEE